MGSMLRQGSRGTEVSELQAALNFHIRRPEPPLIPDGIFGPKTGLRLRMFQALANIQIDGIAGPQTFSRLYQVADGAIEGTITRKGGLEATGAPAGRGPVPSPRTMRFHPGLLQGMPPASPLSASPKPPPVRQTKVISGGAFDIESKFVFTPLDKEQPFKFTFSPKINWPVFLPKPLKLEIEHGMSGGGGFILDAKLKVPFKLIDTSRFELKPYFFAGAGVRQDGFSDLNVGAAAGLKLNLIDLGRNGLRLGLEADGGVKYLQDIDKGSGKFKGILEGALIFEGRF
jgi:hypothetical protein